MMVDQTYAECQQVRKAVGENGGWTIGFHTRYDFPDAVRLCGLIETLRPLFVEDLVRSENPEVHGSPRPQAKVPVAVEEHHGIVGTPTS